MRKLTEGQKADIDAKDPLPETKVRPLSEAHAAYAEGSPRMMNVGATPYQYARESNFAPLMPEGDKTFENESAPTPPDWPPETVQGEITPVDPKKAWGDKKIPVNLVNPLLILEEAQQMRIGAYKYGIYNYVGKPLPAMTYVAAMFRHYLLWAGGEDTDPETGRSHLTAIRACCGILRTQQMNGDMVDDRPDWGDVRALIGELDLNWEEIKPLLDKQIAGMER